MKKIVSLVLVLSMVLSMFSFVSASSLKDVANTKYEAAVDALMELGVVSGYPDGTYLPNNVVTRAELAKLLVTAYGLEQAAEVAKGVTAFNDVAEDHWATGYINVASDYKFVNGYPDGSFRPDATVTYAEAITMALRVLGYANEVDSKGTWPTNYIAKAQDLKLMRDITYASYNDGAQRGNVALLIWNMLRAPMWEITGKTEGDGLYSEPRHQMINVKFSDYEYFDSELELVVTDIDVDGGKVKVTLHSEKYDADLADAPVELEEGIDFLNVFGRKVSVLYNEKEDKIVMLTPSSDDKVVEGVAFEIDENGNGDYKFTDDTEVYTWGTERANLGTYTVAVIGSKKVVDYATAYAVKAGVVESTKTLKDKTTIKFRDDSTLATLNDMDEDVIFLLDGEWKDATEVKKGDVVTELVKDELYAITRETVKGSFDEVKTEDDADEGFDYSIVVAGKKYKFIPVNEVIEIDEDGEDLDPVGLGSIMAAKKDDKEYKFYDKDCTLYFNVAGQVIRIEFEEVEDIESVGHFYVLTNKKPIWTVSDKTGEKDYVELDGETYEIKGTATHIDALENDDAGSVVYVKFDAKERVKELYLLPDSAEAIEEDYTIGEKNDEKSILDDDNYIKGTNIKVNSNTVVYTITPVEDEDDDTIIDHYEVKTSKGTDALKGVKYAVYAVDAEDDFTRAAYVFVWDDAVSDAQFGIVKTVTYSKGIYKLTIGGKVYELDEDEAVPTAGDLVEFVVKADGTIKINESDDPDNMISNAKQVTKVDAELFTMDDDSQFDMEAFKKNIGNDCKIVFIEASENTKAGSDYKFDSVEEQKVEDAKVRRDDRVIISPADAAYDDIEYFFIIRGVDRDYGAI